jgi:hypothetical protein
VTSAASCILDSGVAADAHDATAADAHDATAADAHDATAADAHDAAAADAHDATVADAHDAAAADAHDATVADAHDAAAADAHDAAAADGGDAASDAAADGGDATITCAYGATMYGQSGEDDACKYQVSWSAPSICQSATTGVTFTVTVTDLSNNAKTTGIPGGLLFESFLSSAPDSGCDDQSDSPEGTAAFHIKVP